MNEAIRPRGELTMTVICADCTHQYGAWRPRCPACGTETPRPKRFNEPRIKREVTRRVKEFVARECKTLCIFCRQRGAKSKCPHCDELIHGTCQGLHDADCKQFQEQRKAALAAVGL